MFPLQPSAGLPARGSRQPTAGPSTGDRREQSTASTLGGSLSRGNLAGSSVEVGLPCASFADGLTRQPIDIDHDGYLSPPPSPTLSIKSNRSSSVFTAFDAPDTNDRSRAYSTTSTASRAMSMDTGTPFERAPPVLPSRQRPIHPKGPGADDGRDARLAGLSPPRPTIPTSLMEGTQVVNQVAQAWLLAPGQSRQDLSVSDFVQRLFGAEPGIEVMAEAMRGELGESRTGGVFNELAHYQPTCQPRPSDYFSSSLGTQSSGRPVVAPEASTKRIAQRRHLPPRCEASGGLPSACSSPSGARR